MKIIKLPKLGSIVNGEVVGLVKNKHAVALGRKGGKAGTGKAKARTSEQARKAALARWKMEASK